MPNTLNTKKQTRKTSQLNSWHNPKTKNQSLGLAFCLSTIGANGKWQRWLDSNQRMSGSKPDALPTWRHPCISFNNLKMAEVAGLEPTKCQDQNLMPYQLGDTPV